MKFENTEVNGFKAAFRGMRNSYDSWDKSDSYFGLVADSDKDVKATAVAEAWCKHTGCTKHAGMSDEELTHNGISKRALDIYTKRLEKIGIVSYKNLYIQDVAYIGPHDFELAQKLIQAGPEHCKFLRQITVTTDITAPLYVWKELDTYKIGTTANSTSTMHTITKNPITIDNFEIGDYNPDLSAYETTFPLGGSEPAWSVGDEIKDYIDFLNTLREKYLETKDQRYWKELIRWLPESWLQTRTWSANYAVLRNIYHQRKHHKLTEWSTDFIHWIDTLPCAADFIEFEN